jgi:hypothetical protein
MPRRSERVGRGHRALRDARAAGRVNEAVGQALGVAAARSCRHAHERSATSACAQPLAMLDVALRAAQPVR